MARIRILHASVNPEFYDCKKLSKMTFDEAVDFFEHDDREACTYGITTINDTVEQELTLHAEGVGYDCVPDTMLNWIKVDCV